MMDVVNALRSGSVSLLVIQTHQQIVLKPSLCSSSLFPALLHRPMISKSPKEAIEFVKPLERQFFRRRSVRRLSFNPGVE